MTTRDYTQATHIGVDIGGTKMEVGLFDHAFTLIKSWRVATPTSNYQEFLFQLVDLIQTAQAMSAEKATVGVGMPGILDKQGQVTSANIPCANGQTIKTDLEDKLNLNVAIENDCRLFALSEAVGGAGANSRIVYGAIIGTGAGGGLCVEGKLFQSTNHIAGEYGHLPVSAELVAKYSLPIRQCGCGLRGCAETFIAGPGLGFLYQHFGANTDSTLDLVNAYKSGDEIATKTFNCFIDLLGSSLASLVLSYDPDTIVLGGGLSKISAIYPVIKKATEAHLFKGVTAPNIVPAVYGDSSGVRGAAILGSQFTTNHD